MRKFRWLIISFGLLFAACTNTQKPVVQNQNTTEITVSAAASLQDAFREIGALYERQTGVKINFNFAASGALQQQIEQGAPVDVFASAGQQQLDKLQEKDLIVPETRRDFVKNELVFIVAKTSGESTFKEFLRNETARMAIGNPKTVPAGVYAEEQLRHLGVWKKLEPRLIFAEDVRQVLDYVARGETEFGMVYVSDAKTAADKVRVFGRVEIDSDPILYPIAVVKNSRNQSAAAKFIELVVSREGQAILQKQGFMTVNS